MPAHVVQQQHQREGQPVAHHHHRLAAAADAGGNQTGGDVHQQQFPVERQPAGAGPVSDHKRPHEDRDAAGQRESALSPSPRLSVIAISFDVDASICRQ